jgi:hypothetical protein
MTVDTLTFLRHEERSAFHQHFGSDKNRDLPGDRQLKLKLYTPDLCRFDELVFLHRQFLPLLVPQLGTHPSQQ